VVLRPVSPPACGATLGGGAGVSTATRIEWTEVTWNPTTGCDRISPGCDHCYALRLAKRLKAMGQAKYQRDGDPRTSGPGFGVTIHEDALAEPLRWRKPRKVFVNSMSDIGHARVPASFVASVFAVMALSPQHSFQVLDFSERQLGVVGVDLGLGVADMSTTC
jgi:protein gp37